MLFIDVGENIISHAVGDFGNYDLWVRATVLSVRIRMAQKNAIFHIKEVMERKANMTRTGVAGP